MKTLREAIGEGLAEYRVKAGLSQQELADAMGVSRSLVGLWEQGRSPVAEKHIEDYATLMNVHLEDFKSIVTLGERELQFDDDRHWFNCILEATVFLNKGKS